MARSKPAPAAPNKLFYGDNLQMLCDREHFPDGCVDLIYLDPPFNSKRDYNLLFKSPKGAQSEAQITAFEDSWHWGSQAEREFDELLHQPNTDVAAIMQALRSFLGMNDMMAYLTMMANRLLEMHRVLKYTGSLYLHCDPTASHYLKVVLDGVFGKEWFRNEIIWKRTSAHSSAMRYGPIHDVIFYYTKNEKRVWNQSYAKYDIEYLRKTFNNHDSDGRLWKSTDLTGDGVRHGESGESWHGVNVTAKQRHWAVPYDAIPEVDLSGHTVLDRLNVLEESGYIHWPGKKSGVPRLKQYADEMPGVALQSIWTDIPPIGAQSAERLGYPTQKPLGLLERIINASSNKGDVVLDPFCGCGTAVHAAQKLGRNWIGIDITHLAISLIEKRLKDAFKGKEKAEFTVYGTPQDLEGARDLAKRDPLKSQFEYWAVSLVDAQPYRGKVKGADSGIDGIKRFYDIRAESPKIVLVSVKGGDNIGVSMIRDLKGTMDREKAEIGLFITLTPPTTPMVKEAASAGVYKSDTGKTYQRLQILTIEDLMSGQARAEHPDYTPDVNFKKAKRETKRDKATLFTETPEASDDEESVF